MKNTENKYLNSLCAAGVRAAKPMQIELRKLQHNFLTERKTGAAASGSGKDIQAYSTLEKQYNSLICELDLE